MVILKSCPAFPPTLFGSYIVVNKQNSKPVNYLKIALCSQSIIVVVINSITDATEKTCAKVTKNYEVEAMSRVEGSRLEQPTGRDKNADENTPKTRAMASGERKKSRREKIAPDGTGKRLIAEDRIRSVRTTNRTEKDGIYLSLGNSTLNL